MTRPRLPSKPWSLPWITPRWSAESIALTLRSRALGSAVPDDAGVVLVGDVGLRVDEDADRHLAVDLELQDRRRVLGRLVGRVGELHAARLHAAAGEDLRLDHGRLADLLGRGPG